MRAHPPARRTFTPKNADALYGQQTCLQSLLEPLLDLAEHSDYLVGGSAGEVSVGREVFQIPRFIFMGPTGGGEIIRLGIFAALHGDEPEGAEAAIQFLQELERAPMAARGYHIYIYPLCNPSGFVNGSRNNAAGADLAKHFWRKSSEPEAYYLERELGVLRFQGVIYLQTLSRSNSFTLDTNSDILNRAFVSPAIQAAQRFLPGKVPPAESNASLPDALPSAPPPGFLTATDELRPTPFELHLGIPRQAPKPSQVYGTINALKSVLDSYRALLSIGQNL